MTVTGRAVRRIDVAERRARLGRRHRLAVPAEGPAEAARALVALHGTDPTTTYLSAWARSTAGGFAAMDRALYEDRTLLRVMGMRRTVFAVPVEMAPAVLAACSRRVADDERRTLLVRLAEAGVADDVAAWLEEVEAAALAALDELGEATATALGACDPRLRTELVVARGRAYEGVLRVGSRVLLVLSAQGQVVRTRPLGTWTSTQFRWSPAARWVPGGLPQPPVEDAERDLARRWLAAFGPATVADLRWWTGWTLTRTRAALAGLGVVPVDLDGTPGVVLPDDVDPEPAPDPWVALLPALDPTPMGWTGRDFYLGGHAAALFDRTGNVSPTVWVDGRIAGGWGQRPDGEVVVRMLEDVGAEAASAVERRAAELTAHLAGARLAPRGRNLSPLERDLREG